MSNPAGRASSATVETQALRTRSKSGKSPRAMSSDVKAMKRLVMGPAAAAQQKKAFDLAYRSLGLPFVAALIVGDLVRLNEADPEHVPERVKTTTRSKHYDQLRRIAEKVNAGEAAIPDSVNLELVPAEDLDLDLNTDLPEVEGGN